MVKLLNGDCLDLLKKIPDNSIDLIITDLPYGVTNNIWDAIIPFSYMWMQLKRIRKNNTAIILFAQDKFTAKLILSNEKEHRYNLIWDKELSSGFLNANKMPLRSHEDICIFYKSLPPYNPQKIKGNVNNSKGIIKVNKNNNYGSYNFQDNRNSLKDLKHPKSILRFQKPHPSIANHPTEKSVPLLEFLIKSYSYVSHTVLDFTMGSGSTGVAAVNLGRDFIGIEKEDNYFKIAEKRIFEAEQNSIF